MHSDVLMKMTGAMFAAAALIATPASALDFHNYDTGANQEKLTLIPGDQVHRVFYSLYLEDALQANDVLLAMTEFMATNDTGATQRLSSQLILANSDTAIAGTALDEANDRNITPNGGVPPGHGGMHHCIRVKGAIKQFAAAPGSGKRYVNLIVWATGDLTVPIGSGRLQALKIRP